MYDQFEWMFIKTCFTLNSAFKNVLEVKATDVELLSNFPTHDRRYFNVTRYSMFRWQTNCSASLYIVMVVLDPSNSKAQLMKVSDDHIFETFKVIA